MKEDEKNSFGDTGVTQEIDFNDGVIDKLYIKDGPKKDYTFKN